MTDSRRLKGLAELSFVVVVEVLLYRRYRPSPPERVPRGKLAAWSDGKASDGVVVAVLGVSEGEPVVDLGRFAAGVAAVGLDQGVVEPLGLEPGEEEVS